MIAEPYICIKGQRAGKIEWNPAYASDKEKWKPYADFEREKVNKLRVSRAGIYTATFTNGSGFGLSFYENRDHAFVQYWSDELIGYTGYISDSESSRLLRRAEFLRAICEEEDVEWLPRQVATGGFVAGDLPLSIDHPCCIMRHCPFPVPENDTYTREEESLRDPSCACLPEDGPCKLHGEEWEFRRALLDLLASSPLAGTYEQDRIADLRRRFVR